MCAAGHRAFRRYPAAVASLAEHRPTERATLMDEPTPRFPVVALVSSAGGLNALIRVLGALPGDLPAAVLVAQHLAPHSPSILPEILDRRTALPVSPAHSDELLMPGRVLAAPAGQHMLVLPPAAIVLIPVGDL